MIYLLDDKTSRQTNEFGWNQNRFLLFEKIIQLINNSQEVEKELDNLFSKGNIILYHESFIMDGQLKELYLKKLKKAIDDGTIECVYFSGSNDRRICEGNIASCNPKILYSNLEYCLTQTLENGKISLPNFIFGEFAETEEVLVIKKEIWDLLFLEPREIKISFELRRLIDEYNQCNLNQIDLDALEEQGKNKKIDINYLKFLINE